MTAGIQMQTRNGLWIGLQCMAGLVLVGWLLLLARAPLQAIGYCRGYFLSYEFWLLLPVKVVMLAGCAGAVFRRRWGAAALRTTILYLAVSSLPFGVFTLREIVERIRWGAPLNFGGGPDFGSNSVPLWPLQLATYSFAVVIVVVSAFVLRAEYRTEVENLQPPRATAGRKRVMLWGAGLAVAGLLYKSLQGPGAMASAIVTLGPKRFVCWEPWDIALYADDGREVAVLRVV